MERLDVRIVTFNETVVQKNRVKTLYRHGKPLEEKLALSDLAGGRTNSAFQLQFCFYFCIGMFYLHGEIKTTVNTCASGEVRRFFPAARQFGSAQNESL